MASDTTAYFVLLAVALFVVVVAVANRGFERRSPISLVLKSPRSEKDDTVPRDSHVDGEQALRGTDWRDTEPIKFRPFKPTYYITMALQASAPEELILMDTNYKPRVLERRRTMQDHRAIVMGTIPAGHAAVSELYTFLLSDYLPSRYPDMFSLERKRAIFQNRVTERAFPAAPPTDPLTALEIIGETVEDDMFLLRETDAGHLCVAFLCCHPAGFDPSTKLGKVLEEIHAPVPGYEKIGPSMERFFAKLEVGRSVKRLNWSITTETKLFTPAGTHIHAEDEFEKDEDVDIDQVRLRVELQTLTRLPETKAILFSFKTYVYPLKDIKEEGLGLQLADAIEGLKKGNTPGMFKYKGAVRWGKSACEYLRE